MTPLGALLIPAWHWPWCMCVRVLVTHMHFWSSLWTFWDTDSAHGPLHTWYLFIYTSILYERERVLPVNIKLVLLMTIWNARHDPGPSTFVARMAQQRDTQCTQSSSLQYLQWRLVSVILTSQHMHRIHLKPATSESVWPVSSWHIACQRAWNKWLNTPGRTPPPPPESYTSCEHWFTCKIISETDFSKPMFVPYFMTFGENKENIYFFGSTESFSGKL